MIWGLAVQESLPQNCSLEVSLLDQFMKSRTRSLGSRMQIAWLLYLRVLQSSSPTGWKVQGPIFSMISRLSCLSLECWSLCHILLSNKHKHPPVSQQIPRNYNLSSELARMHTCELDLPVQERILGEIHPTFFPSGMNAGFAKDGQDGMGKRSKTRVSRCNSEKDTKRQHGELKPSLQRVKWLLPADPC